MSYYRLVDKRSGGSSHGVFTLNGNSRDVSRNGRGNRGSSSRGPYATSAFGADPQRGASGDGYDGEAFTGEAFVSRGTGSSSARNKDWDRAEDDDGNLIKRNVRYQDTSFYVVAKVPSSSGTDPDLKSRVYEDAVAEVRSHNFKDWTVKATFMSNHFGFPTALRGAQSKISALGNPFSNRFGYMIRGFMEEDFTPIALPGAGAPVPNNARFVRYDATMDPANELNGLNTPVTIRTGRLHSVLVRLVLNAAGDPLPAYTMANCASAQLINDFHEANGHQTMIGQYNTREDVFDETVFTEWREKLYSQVLFEVTVALLRTSYVGSGAFITPEARLNMCHQRMTTNGRTHTSSVQAYYKKFTGIVFNFPQDQRFGNLTNTFYNGLSEDIRKRMISNGYVAPMTAAADNHTELERINQARDAAQHAESNLNLMVDLIQMNSGSKPRGEPIQHHN